MMVAPRACSSRTLGWPILGLVVACLFGCGDSAGRPAKIADLPDEIATTLAATTPAVAAEPDDLQPETATPADAADQFAQVGGGDTNEAPNKTKRPAKGKCPAQANPFKVRYDVTEFPKDLEWLNTKPLKVPTSRANSSCSTSGPTAASTACTSCRS